MLPLHQYYISEGRIFTRQPTEPRVIMGTTLAPRTGLEPVTHRLTVCRATDCANEEYIPTTKITNSAGTISLKTSLVMFCSMFHLLRFLFIYCSSNRKPHIGFNLSASGSLVVIRALRADI